MAMKRELIEPHKGDKGHTRRDAGGTFTTDQVDVQRSLAADNKPARKGGLAQWLGRLGRRKEIVPLDEVDSREL
jgi:hypothetical protein